MAQMKARRYAEDAEEVREQGMDIGDYDYIDHLYHCPMVDWVRQGKVLKKLKD